MDQHPKANIHSERIAGTVVGLVAAVLLFTTFNGNYFTLDDPDEVRTVLVPRILLLLLILFSLILLARNAFGDGKATAGEVINWTDGAGWTRMAATVVITAAVAASLKFVGLYLAMVAGIFLIGAVIGFRRWIILGFVSFVAPALAWYVIVEIAELTLPGGALLKLTGLG